ncbi:OLC1v1017763C1 [Oldenlandia corymbosa var. corymbosa]|uniref:OLC1v1017763C1 n=1 Tax=Oldenlandia corymbosa var. corymbosa TaxID=529605 RepID=A0AAV1EA75_OLDCO|nr:OLC1v1017763C1 [Oldenlandia corymbosa var. corymbosa]
MSWIYRGAHLRPALYVEVADEPVQDVGEGTSGGQYDGAGSRGLGGTNEDDDDTEDDVHENSDEEYVPSDESDDDYSDHDASSVVISIFDDISDMDKSELDEDSDGITMWDGNWQTARHGVHFANKKEVQTAVGEWTLRQGRACRVKYSRPYTWAAECETKGPKYPEELLHGTTCLWKCRATLQKDTNTWRMVVWIESHNCLGATTRNEGRNLTSTMIARLITANVRKDPGYSVAQIQVERWENRHNTLAGLQTDMTLEPQAAPEYLVWYQNHTVTLVTNPSDYRQPQGFQGSAESLHIMANLVQNMRHITLDGLQRNPADSWNHNAFLQLHDLTQQAITVSKTSVWADSENPSQDFVPADATQEYIPPRPPRTDRGGFQLGSGRMRKPVATQDTGGQSSTPMCLLTVQRSPHHHPSPPFEQMHFDSDFINLDPNLWGFFETSYEGGHHSRHLDGDDIHNDREDDQDHEDIRDREHDDDAMMPSIPLMIIMRRDQGQGPSDGTMPFTPIALGKGQRNIKKKKKCCMTDSQEKKRKM